MSNRTILNLLALTFIPKIGTRTINTFVDLGINIDDLFRCSVSQLQTLGLPKAVALSITTNYQGALARAQHIIDHCTKVGVNIVGLTSPLYPTLLKECADAPVVLYVRGNVELLSNPYSISCVGTRKCTGSGISITNSIIAQAAQSGLPVSIVSGLALGIDRISHLAAINEKLPTVAVLPGFVDDVTPSSHFSLAKTILEKGGALVSEMPPSTSITRGHFITRNRIVAGISPVTIMFQSNRKGGAMVTADMANGYERELFAPPAATTDQGFEGNIELLKSQRANMLCSFDDIVNVMGWESTPRAKKTSPALDNLTPDELKVYSVMPENDYSSIDQIAYQTQLSIAKASVALTMLELKGMIVTSKGRLYHKL